MTSIWTSSASSFIFFYLSSPSVPVLFFCSRSRRPLPLSTAISARFFCDCSRSPLPLSTAILARFFCDCSRRPLPLSTAISSRFFCDCSRRPLPFSIAISRLLDRLTPRWQRKPWHLPVLQRARLTLHRKLIWGTRNFEPRLCQEE